MTRPAPRALPVLLVAIVLLCLLALAPTLRAAVVATPRVATMDVAVGAVARAKGSGSGTVVRTVRLPIRADMLGATWTGTAAQFELRARGADGRWSRWTELDAGGDGPDPSSGEARAMRGRHALAVPLWVGDAEHVEVRTSGRVPVHDLHLTAINTAGTATRSARIARAARRTAADVLGVAVPRTAGAMPANPGVASRTAWGAGTARNAPIYADRAQGVVIHHTVNVNTYSCAQVPALLRGIQRYHEGTLGWNDIGYNFVVDRCGRVWEGRGGGITQAVIGAHTMGFNTGTVGIAVLGTFSNAPVPLAARTAVARLVAWRLDVAHVAPTSTMTLTARSSDKFPVGTVVTMPAVSGHRDLFPTSCPGRLAYGQLRTIAATATRTGGLKVANITTSQTIDDTTGAASYVRVRATSNSAVAATTISLRRASDGSVISSATSTGRVALLRFSTSLEAAPRAWDVRVHIESRMPTGQVARAYDAPLITYATDPGLSITTPPPASVSPGGDPVDDAITFSYTMANRARLGVWLYDPGTLTWIRTLQASQIVEPTTTPTPVTVPIPGDLPDGDYQLRIGAEDDTAPARSMHRYALHVSRTV